MRSTEPLRTSHSPACCCISSRSTSWDDGPLDSGYCSSCSIVNRIDVAETMDTYTILRAVFASLHTKPSISPRTQTDKLYATASSQSSLSATTRLLKHQISILQGCEINCQVSAMMSMLNVRAETLAQDSWIERTGLHCAQLCVLLHCSNRSRRQYIEFRVHRSILRTISRYCDGSQRGRSISEAHRKYSGRPVASFQPSLYIKAALVLSTLPSIDAWRLVEAQASGQARDAGQIQIANAGARVGLISTATALWIACIGTVPRARASECSETLRFSGACSPF